jgi:hypothetical protein
MFGFPLPESFLKNLKEKSFLCDESKNHIYHCSECRILMEIFCQFILDEYPMFKMMLPSDMSSKQMVDVMLEKLKGEMQ